MTNRERLLELSTNLANTSALFTPSLSLSHTHTHTRFAYDEEKQFVAAKMSWIGTLALNPLGPHRSDSLHRVHTECTA